MSEKQKQVELPVKEKEPYFTAKTTKKKSRLMKCTYNECVNTFVAFPHARFCEYHKDPSTRPKEKVVEENTMFKFPHKFSGRITIERACNCCGKPYQIEIYPEREDYPCYCKDHQNEWKRKHWRMTHGEK